MARPLRLEYEGALYHLTSRGDRREAIFEDDVDRRAFLDVLADSVARFDATVFSYCLMDNHYHLVVQTNRANLSSLMRQLNGVYTQRYNRRHSKVGHLLQGRYKAIVVDRDSYFMEVCRYVDLNPVRAAMVKHPRDWRWSSYRAHTGRVAVPAWMNSAELHRQLAPRAPRRDGPGRYADFVAAGREVRLWESSLAGQIFLGADEFVQRMRARASATFSRDIPRAQRQGAPKPLEWYLSRHDRNTAIAEAYAAGGHTQTAIASSLGLSVSRVSRLVAASRAKGKT